MPAVCARFLRHLKRSLVRAGYAAVTALRYVPVILLMLGVAVALRRLAEIAPDPLAWALPWLRRAAVAAALMVMLRPVTDSLDVMLLFLDTLAGPRREMPLDFDTLLQGY